MRIVTTLMTVAVSASVCCESEAVEPATRPVGSVLDCVAVLGIIPSTLAQAPLESIPYSGVPREKLISELTEDELGRLCDYDDCLSANGYLRNCYQYQYSSFDHNPFVLETVSLLQEASVSCFPNSNPADGKYDVTWRSQEDCKQIYRDTFGRCDAGIWEDCLREASAAPVASHWWPSCTKEREECGR